MLPKPKKIQTVYLDHAAATSMDSRVVLAMKPFFTEIYGNPSSLHSQGEKAGKALADCRGRVAKVLGTNADNIIFTASGTESNNLAIFGVARAHESAGKNIVTTAIEHDAVLKPLGDLENSNWKITYTQLNNKGLIRTEDVIGAITKETVLVSIIYANNEIGSIAPIAEIGRQILQYRKNNNTIYPFFHVDACQAAGYLDLSVDKLHADLLSVNGSKIYGPKGTGLLYVRSNVVLKSLILGGGQEKSLRSGTENMPGIAGLTMALQLAQKNKDSESKKIQNLAAYFWRSIQKQIPDVALNGPEIGPDRLVNNLNINFMGLEGEALLLYLDAYGVMCSVGSACASKTSQTSHILKALGLSYEAAKGSVRFSLGKENTKQQIDYVMKYLPNIVAQLREVEKIK
jgi:cysteine desulfurase